MLLSLLPTTHSVLRDTADAKRIAELEKANSKLEVRLQRAKEAYRQAEDARKTAVLDLNALVRDVEEQVGPVAEQAAEAADTAQAARALTKQRERMFQALVARGNELAAQLGADAPHAEARGRGDAALYLVYFDQLFTALESPVADLREVIEVESRQLLGVAVDRIFTNLRLLTPGFDLATVTEERTGEEVLRVSNSLREQVETFCNRFKRAEVAAEDSEEEAALAEEEDAEEEEHAGADSA